MPIQDSGNRREFASGAVRDIDLDKGRCDLLPLDIIADIMYSDVLKDINFYLRGGKVRMLEQAVKDFIVYDGGFKELYTTFLEVAKHYGEGCNKYGDRNWEKGIPLHCYIDSGVRHYLKWKRGDDDERHDRAFVWNMLGCLWTHQQCMQGNLSKELMDLPFSEKKKEEDI